MLKMSLSSLLLWGIGVIIIISLLSRIRWMIRTRNTINKIPGPPSYPVIGNILDFYMPSDKLWVRLRTLARKYYPVYRLWGGPWAVIGILSPNDIEVVLSSPKHITKSRLYDLLVPWLRKGLLTSTGLKWQSRRKILTPTFHFSILQQFLPIITEQSEVLVNRLKEECSQSQTDVLPIITKFTLHSICETAMGTRLNEATAGQKQYVQTIYRFGEVIYHRVVRPWLYLDAAYFFSPRFWEMKKLAKTLHSFSEAVIRQRKENFQNNDFSKQTDDDHFGKKRLAMLDLLISAQKAGTHIDDEGIREEVDTFMFEGHDTTAMSISFTLLLLANHRNIQDRVVEELQEIFGTSNRSATYQDLQNMTYLEMVLKESLRVFPSVPLIARVLEEDVQLPSGFVVPATVPVHIYIYDLHHDPKLYPEPEKFDPDRFLPENTQKRHPFAYIPFSAGPRNCIGQKFAMMELKSVISSILRQFILKPIDAPDDIVLLMDMVIRPKHGVKVKFVPRPSVVK